MVDFEQKYLSTNHPSLFVLTLTVMAHSECVRIIHTNVRHKHTIFCWLDFIVCIMRTNVRNMETTHEWACKCFV